jgi:hypothetical protein
VKGYGLHKAQGGSFALVLNADLSDDYDFETDDLSKSSSKICVHISYFRRANLAPQKNRIPWLGAYT